MIGIERSSVRRINDAERLVGVANRQGVTLNIEEADMLLGYLEGHDYCLMADDEGGMVRHDKQYEDDHSEDEPYSIQDTIGICYICGSPLFRSLLDACDYQCFTCDEVFYQFEQDV